MCLVYKRFDWDNAAIQKCIRMGTRTAGMGMGPGEYHKGKMISKGNQGMFDRGKRDVKLSKNPGPGSYFQAGYTCSSGKKDKYTF